MSGLGSWIGFVAAAGYYFAEETGSGE